MDTTLEYRCIICDTINKYEPKDNPVNICSECGAGFDNPSVIPKDGVTYIETGSKEHTLYTLKQMEAQYSGTDISAEIKKRIAELMIEQG